MTQIYKGWLRDGSVVLINCIKIKQKGLPHSIMQHLDVLPNLRHRHMVSVLGHCIITHQDPPQVTSTVFIVLEYISNVTLRDQLTGKLFSVIFMHCQFKKLCTIISILQLEFNGCAIFLHKHSIGINYSSISYHKSEVWWDDLTEYMVAIE
jgi:serine/threonine protein kinase